MNRGGPLEIPAAPGALELAVERRWDGAPLRDPALRARVVLCAEPDALCVAASMPEWRTPRVPEAPRGARVEGLWRFDVVECFFAAGDGRYLELELGAGGHYLALAFDAPRRRVRDFASETLAVEWRAEASGWASRCRVPRAWIPEPVAAVNAFAIAGGEFLVHRPVGGADPDFHRPDHFPRAAVPCWEHR